MKIELELPVELASYIQDVAGDDDPGSPAVRAVIIAWLAEAMQRRQWLDAELRKGMESGDSDRTFDQIWDDAVEKARSRAA
jgi:Arc/MetJ-type ribon-helix-helix transcriptional regulator